MQILDWLQKRKWWIAGIAVGVGLAIAAHFLLWPKGIGFEDKTLWDWLELLGVPLSLAVLGFWIQQQEKSRDAATAKAQRASDEDSAKEEALQVYFDRISTLLIDKNLKAIAAKLKTPGNENVQQPEALTVEEQELLDASLDVIRARTLSILRRFENDGSLKGIVIQFLIESEIINKLKLSLIGAILNGSNLIRYQPAQCRPVRCRLERCQPARCQPARCLPARCLPI